MVSRCLVWLFDEVRFFGSADLMCPAEVQVVFYVKSYEYH